MKRLFLYIGFTMLLAAATPCFAQSGEFQAPWKDNSTALVLDTFKGNSIDWSRLTDDPRVAGIIHRATMGFKKDDHYARRKARAKKLGYKWGSYHLGKPGNPIKQADFYLRTVRPKKDELLALDLEEADSKKFMSLDDAQLFIMRIKKKTGRYPMVYGNYKVIEAISNRYGQDSVFAKTPLWFARFRSDIPEFPKGIWQTYTLWQFSSEINCKPTCDCLYLVPGTETDMDVNVYHGSVDELKRDWPFGKE